MVMAARQWQAADKFSLSRHQAKGFLRKLMETRAIQHKKRTRPIAALITQKDAQIRLRRLAALRKEHLANPTSMMRLVIYHLQ
jgi:hypothetical protein